MAQWLNWVYDPIEAARIAADRIPENVRKSPRFHLPQVVMPVEGVSLKEVTPTRRKLKDNESQSG